MDLKAYIRDIPDFPRHGILFRDISPLLKDGQAYRHAIVQLHEFATQHNVEVVVGPESRGFLFGAPLALALGVGFVPIRKKGRLPGEVCSVEYQLEYGTDTLEMLRDSLRPGQRVLIVDDLLATGGTGLAAVQLVEQASAVVAGAAFIIELSGLGGREKLAGHEVYSVISY
ncbi:MAG TPA: adenine phosphoribosyltransferase [Bacillota bacterium]|nr:adenine phosphoribosyltransferase [Bacillota bacterium]